MVRIVCVGEGMLELTGSAEVGWRLSYGGDTLNTAVYLARFGHDLRYLTALGTDPYSADLRQAWRGEGIDLSLVLADPERLPGLYTVRTDPTGERSFFYWRTTSAARRLFALPQAREALAAASDAALLYLSGISLSLFDGAARDRLAVLAAQVREQGGDVAFDPNYRAGQWTDAVTAKQAITRFAAHVSIALPTFSDEQQLFDDEDPLATAARWSGYGAREVAVKLGADGCLTRAGDRTSRVRPSRVVRPVDTTGAGDAFNAAYLDARMNKRSVVEAAKRGNALAGRVIAHPGAIIPRD